MRKRITFVGSGTPDPQLLTVRAAGVLREARTVVADAETASLARASMATDSRLVLLEVSMSFAQRMRAIQDELNAAGEIVRLIGGDPVVDGVLANELEALAGVAQTVVVPGITSAANAAAFSGMSLTGNRVRELRVVEAGDPDIEWFGPARETLIVKGVGGSPERVLEALVASGREPSTPFRIVCHAGSPDQHTTMGTLGNFDESLATAELTADAVLFVGDVVRHGVDWFELLPLFGWRVLVPRTKDSLSETIIGLERQGAVATTVSTLSVEPPRSQQQMDRACAGLVEGRYGWAVFTCANAFAAVWAKCREYGLDARVFAGIQLAAVGEDTIEAMVSAGLRAELVPHDAHTTQALLDLFPDADAHEESVNRVLVPRADIATETLAAGLVELGWEVEEVMAFRTVRSAPPPAEVRDAIKLGNFDAVVFTSSATVRNLIGLAGKPNAQTLVACIGPGTAKAAEEHGLRVDVIAATPTQEALLEAIVSCGERWSRDFAGGITSARRPSLQRASARRKAK